MVKRSWVRIQPVAMLLIFPVNLYHMSQQCVHKQVLEEVQHYRFIMKNVLSCADWANQA